MVFFGNRIKYYPGGADAKGESGQKYQQIPGGGEMLSLSTPFSKDGPEPESGPFPGERIGNSE